MAIEKSVNRRLRFGCMEMELIGPPSRRGNDRVPPVLDGVLHSVVDSL